MSNGYSSTEVFTQFEAKLSETNPVRDYVKLMDKHVRRTFLNDEMQLICWKRVSAVTRETVWNLLFGDNIPPERLETAIDLMKLLKGDSGFYYADEYNEWIVQVRDELLRRNMVDFWRNVIVKCELGPCWARDSDLFEDSNDSGPLNFYKFADCEAPWLSSDHEVDANVVCTMHSSTESSSDMDTIELREISVDNAFKDYKHNVRVQGVIDENDENAFKAIFAEARKMVWELLFGETILTEKRAEEASKLLEEYKLDACFYNPQEYNEWIPTIRNELMNRRYFDFWDVIIKKDLGLCWGRNCEYFDDMDDTEPREFYRVGEEFMEELKEM